MADLREQLRPLVERPASDPPPVGEVAARAGARRRARRVRITALAGGLAMVGALVVVAGPDRSTVTTIDPANSTSTSVPDAGDPTPTTTAPLVVAPPSTVPDRSATSTTVAPPPAAATVEPQPTVAGIAATATTTSSWETGRCVEIRVENTTEDEVVWGVRYPPGGAVTELWSARSGADGATFTGESWNERLAPRAWTTFGLCVSTG